MALKLSVYVCVSVVYVCVYVCLSLLGKIGIIIIIILILYKIISQY